MNGRSSFLLLFGIAAALAGPGACSRGAAQPGSGRAAAKPAPDAAPARTAPDAHRGQLASVRPPAPTCGDPSDELTALVSRAAAAYARDDHALTLACAEDAIAVAPQSVPALHYRAAALVALGRTDEARLAYARALAVDPDDPETLHGAADLYVLRLSGDRDELELGLAYALRGARLAQRGRRPDRELAAELLVLGAMAENDLGDNAAALRHADEAIALGAPEADARYERGVALYELCRFGEARASLERVVALEPDDAWAHHYLALVTERLGDPGRADALEKRARVLAPKDFPAPVDLDRPGFEAEVRRAIASLPDADRRALSSVPVEIDEVPALEDLTAVDPPLSPSILGLYRGPPEQQRCLPEDGARCRSIVFYRRNLERFARDRAELDEQVKVTLLHELGHYHGESDEQLRARGLE